MSERQMIWAVVPAKLDRNAKERLAPVLAPDLRESLARAMLADVLRAFQQCPEITRTVVVSKNHRALDLGHGGRVEGLTEAGAGGLNASVAQGLAYCEAKGAAAAVVAMGDLPLLRAEHVAAAVARLPRRGVVLVPSADGTGTNLTVARPAGVLRPEFGPGSLARHLAQAEVAGLDIVLHPCASTGLDVDTPADLESLLAAAHPSTETKQVLARARARGEPRVTVGA